MAAVLLPFLAWAALCLIVAGARRSGQEKQSSLAGIFIMASVFWGAVLTAITEGLSLFRAITRPGLSIAWGVVLVGLLVWGWKGGALRRGWGEVWRGFRFERRAEYVFVALFLLLVALLFAVALATPPNTVDSLSYHMPRVVHWAQNRTLAHFATAEAGQNVKPLWAEAAVLNLCVLWGSDQPAGLVQWFLMIASLVGVAGIVRILDGSREAQWLAVAFAFSIPTGILQAPTTLNDYVSAFWIVCLCYLVVLSHKRRLSKIELVALSLALGLGMLTKGTFILYAIPIMAWFLLSELVRSGMRQVSAQAFVIVTLAATLNLGFWYRNVVTYGGPYGAGLPLRVIQGQALGPAEAPSAGSSARLSQRQGQSSLRGFVALSTLGVSVLRPGLPEHPAISALDSLLEEIRGRLSKILRMAVLNLVTPFSWFNTRLFRALRSVPELFPAGYMELLESAQWNNEMTAGSPVHFVLVLISMIVVAADPLRGRLKLHAQLLAAALLGYALISFITYSDLVFSVRYQLSYLLLGAPAFSSALMRVGRRAASLVTLGFFVYAIPYIAISNMRPVIGHPPWPTRVGSVFTTDPSVLFFAQSPDLRDEYQLFAEEIAERGCKKVGLSLAGQELEYWSWWLLKSPQSGVKIQHVTAAPPLDRYLDPGFGPCAILCTHCQGEAELRGLPLEEDAGHVQLYLKPGLPEE